jgi:hypothetical protein
MSAPNVFATFLATCTKVKHTIKNKVFPKTKKESEIPVEPTWVEWADKLQALQPQRPEETHAQRVDRINACLWEEPERPTPVVLTPEEVEFKATHTSCFMTHTYIQNGDRQLTARAGEELWLVRLDDFKDWAWVLRREDGAEGYVPLSFIGHTHHKEQFFQEQREKREKKMREMKVHSLNL